MSRLRTRRRPDSHRQKTHPARLGGSWTAPRAPQR